MAQKRIYRTVKTITDGDFRDKGSRFLATIHPCSNPDDAKKIIESLWKNHPAAVHICYAWRFGKIKFEDRYSDDGEPTNSAGKPIFGQILSYDVSDVLVTVIRYYGGINLGVGGLIQAYKTASKSAFDKATVEERELENLCEIQFPFESTGEVMKLLQQKNVIILNQSHDQTGTIILFKIKESEVSELFSTAGFNSQIKIKEIQKAV